MSYIIAVAGPIGSGKSSLVAVLAEQLPDAATLTFDHYEDVTRKSPHELMQWLEAGADINQFEFESLARDLERLKQGVAVVSPVTGETVEPRTYVVFEMPFGRAHAATAPFIDLVLWIDIPLDIALARKLREHAGMFLHRFQAEEHRQCLAWLHGYLDNYLLFVHDVLAVQLDKVRPGADLLLDGREDPAAMTRQAATFITSKSS
jgi:uridine kinase